MDDRHPCVTAVRACLCPLPVRLLVMQRNGVGRIHCGMDSAGCLCEVGSDDSTDTRNMLMLKLLQYIGNASLRYLDARQARIEKYHRLYYNYQRQHDE
jgi:hypothetical protein